MADSYVSGAVVMSDAQEAFALRNVNMKYYGFGNWNFVHIGNAGEGVPVDHCPADNGWRDSPNSVIDSTPTIREKPYIIYENGKYKLMKPRLETNKKDHTLNWENADEIDFEDVYVASENDSAAIINAKLDEGLHLVLQPGNYNLTESIVVNKEGAVVLGLGLATLISTAGNSVIEIGDVNGVTISGLILQAGEERSHTLLKWGSGSSSGDASNPGAMHDIFARVGGTNDSNVSSLQTDTMLEVNSGNVIIDDAWLWRADHDYVDNIYNQKNPVNNALVVNGDHVTAYGLAAEHTLEHIVDWKGDYGATYFYQAELLYDND